MFVLQPNKAVFNSLNSMSPFLLHNTGFTSFFAQQDQVFQIKIRDYLEEKKESVGVEVIKLSSRKGRIFFRSISHMMKRLSLCETGNF